MAVDRVARTHDAARVAFDLGQLVVRHAGRQQVAQHAARADRGKLVVIADEDQPHAQRDRSQQAVHQPDIDHGGLVDDQHVAIERIGLALSKREFPGVLVDLGRQ